MTLGYEVILRPYKNVPPYNNNSNDNFDHYLTWRLSPQVKTCRRLRAPAGQANFFDILFDIF